MDTSNELIPIVNAADEIIGYKMRKEITREDIYRVSACRITDEEWNILLAQRARTKKHNPWKRWPAVAWTVAKGESYEENIVHEISEEIGLSVSREELTLWFKQFFDHDRQFFGTRFFYIYTGPKELLRAEPWAVEQLRWYTKNELKTYLLTHPDEYSWSIHRMIQND